MKYKFEALQIKNFKLYEDITIFFHQQLNIFTAVNNGGKTTILEAISLWNECFYKLIREAGASDTSLNLTKGQYRLGNKKQNYFSYTDIISIRSPSLEDIFYNLDMKKCIELIATISNDKEKIKIGFSIQKQNGSNYEINLIYDDNFFDYKKFNDFFTGFPNPISVLFTSPIANILLNEEFKTDPVIRDKIIKRNSISVIRNRLYDLSLQETEFIDFQNTLSMILGIDGITLDCNNKKTKDIFIEYTIKFGSKDISKNLSLVGSGTLQIIEILLAIYNTKSDLNIILLDEPDSHIHRDVQKRLLNILIERTKNTQIFLTTHNESFIRGANPSHLFHIERNVNKHYYPINHDIPKSVNIGLQPTNKLKILKQLGSETALDILNALEAEKLFLVEGKSDPIYIDVIINKKYINKRYDVMYWSFDGINNILKHILSYKELFSLIKNEKTLWEKSILIFDKDYFTDNQAIKLRQELEAKLKISIHIWNVYTIEATVLTQIDKFAKFIYKYLDKLKISANIEDIEKQLNEYIDVIVEEKKKLFSDEQKGNIIKWIKEREDNFGKLGLRNSIIKEYVAYDEIKTFHLDKLQNKDISSLATKDDVEKILSHISMQYGIECMKLEDLLAFVNNELYFDEWNKMMENIKI